MLFLILLLALLLTAPSSSLSSDFPRGKVLHLRVDFDVKSARDLAEIQKVVLGFLDSLKELEDGKELYQTRVFGRASLLSMSSTFYQGIVPFRIEGSSERTSAVALLNSKKVVCTGPIKVLFQTPLFSDGSRSVYYALAVFGGGSCVDYKKFQQTTSFFTPEDLPLRMQQRYSEIITKIRARDALEARVKMKALETLMVEKRSNCLILHDVWEKRIAQEAPQEIASAIMSTSFIPFGDVADLKRKLRQKKVREHIESVAQFLKKKSQNLDEVLKEYGRVSFGVCHFKAFDVYVLSRDFIPPISYSFYFLMR